MKRYTKIVETFTKVINKLENLESSCSDRVGKIDDGINQLEVEKRGQEREGRAAKNTCKKLKELIGESDDSETTDG